MCVHARSVWAGIQDAETGEVRARAVPTSSEKLAAWVASQPGVVVAA